MRSAYAHYCAASAHYAVNMEVRYPPVRKSQKLSLQRKCVAAAFGLDYNKSRWYRISTLLEDVLRLENIAARQMITLV